MSHYTIEKCLKMAWIVGAHPDMRNNKWQLSIFVVLAIGNWITIYLIISLLFYKEDTITIGDFAETFSGMSLVIHGIQRSFSLFFNRKHISEMLQYVRSKFWKESELDMTDEEKYVCKKYYNRLKIAMYVFASSCTSNLFGFCCQTFFSDQDVLPLACYKPGWIPFYPFWFLQVLVIFFGVNMAVICLDTLIMTLIVLTHIQFRLLNHEVQNLYSYGFTNGNRKYFLYKLRKIVQHHNFLLRFTQKINMTFSDTFLTYMGIIIIAICIEMYNLSTGANMELFIRATLFTTATLFQFVVFYCIPAQDLTDEAEKTFNSAYFSRWYEHLTDAKPTKSIILQSQQRVFITAGRLIDINLATSLATVKTMVSYCMFLRTMGVEQ